MVQDLVKDSSDKNSLIKKIFKEMRRPIACEMNNQEARCEPSSESRSRISDRMHDFPKMKRRIQYYCRLAVSFTFTHMHKNSRIISKEKSNKI